jgi:predicted MPP superfamily phosphohydrolase
MGRLSISALRNMALILLALGAVGHTILWVALVNRVHGLGIDRRLRNVLTLTCVSLFAAMPFVIGAALIGIMSPQPTAAKTLFYASAWVYILGCAAVCIVATVQRLVWRYHSERRGAVVSSQSTRVRVADQASVPLAAPGVSTWLCRLPGNEVLSICVQRMEVALPRLSPQHAGLRIAHLADLHMSGRLTRAYFEHVVRETNQCEPDIIAITGDIIEYEKCLDWVPDTLGRLRAAHGVYYVLGNHDRRVEKNRLLAALAKAGLIHLGGGTLQVTVRSTPVILCGNELPWFGPAADLSGCAPHNDSGLPLRIALVHTPDQFDWGVENDVDLMLAGHVHGGQVCLPIVGPITAPSLYGVRYAAGTFRKGKTVMHVSRGTSALTPLRWNCPPEIAVLTLRSQS